MVGSALSSPPLGRGPSHSVATVRGWSRRRHSRSEVLTEPGRFDFPGDVSRSGDLSSSRGDTRSGHVTLRAPDARTRWAAACPSSAASGTRPHRARPRGPGDAVRRDGPAATARGPLDGGARCVRAPTRTRDRLADLTLAWIDALAPVISARRPPGRWSRARRAERDARFALDDALSAVPDLPAPPEQVATMLAAGIQVPIAAGAWLLAWLAAHPADHDPVDAVWETLRLTPPTWITARITTETVDLAGTEVPAGRVVLVSPLLLGRSSRAGAGRPGRASRSSTRSGGTDADAAAGRLAALRRRTARLPGPHARPGAARPPRDLGRPAHADVSSSP